MLRSAAFAKPKSDPLRFLLNNGSLMQSIRLPLWFAEKALSPPLHSLSFFFKGLLFFAHLI